VDIIDTPGLNDDERMTKITIDMLQNVDGVVVAISARTPFSDTETRFVCQLIKSSAIHTIVFTVTFLDQLDEEEYSYDSLLGSIRERIREKVLEQLEKDGADEKILNKAHSILDDMHLFGISAKLALKSFVTGSGKMLKESHFEEFKTGLLSIITSKQVENAAVKAVDAIHSVLEQLDGQYRNGMRRISGELEGFQSRSAQINQYCSSCKRAVNDLFMQTDSGFNETLSQIYPLKNVLVSRFIKRLSSIKVNTHEEIKSAIAAETLQCFEFVNNEFRLPVQSALCDNLQSCSRDFAKLRETALLNNLAEPDSDRARFIGNMLAFSGNILENVRFSWQVPTAPPAADLSKCNVIDTIIHAVDISVNQYYNALDSGITQIRKHWFEQVSAEAEAAAELVQQKEDELKNRVDTNLRTYESNYQVMSQNAKVIAGKSDSVLKELYRDSASV
jgi:hypothetical protein